MILMKMRQNQNNKKHLKYSLKNYLIQIYKIVMVDIEVSMMYFQKQAKKYNQKNDKGD